MALRVANDRACEHSPHIGRRRAGAWHRVLGTLARLTNLVLAPRTFLVLFTLAWLAYACGALVTAQLRGRVTVVVILTVGVLSRMLLLPAVPSLSTDAYRYVWDARVSSVGIENLWRLATANQRICACTLGKKMSTADNSNA